MLGGLGAQTVAYARFWSREGGRNFKKFENKDQNKKLLNQNSVRFSCTNLGEEKKKGRSSLKFSPIICPKLGAGQKQTCFAYPLCAQTFCPTRPGATGGAYRGRAHPNDSLCPQKRKLCPPKRKLCPPKRGLCPEEINRLGAPRVQIEAQIGVCHRYFRNFCGLTPDFMTFLGSRPLFFEITCFRSEKPLELPILAGKSLTISVKTFSSFFWRSPVFGRKNRLNSRVWPENPLQFQWRSFLFFWRSPVFGRKKRLNLWSLPCSFDQDWDKFLVPPYPSRIHKNKLLVPPQNLFLPPQSRYPGAGPVPNLQRGGVAMPQFCMLFYANSTILALDFPNVLGFPDALYM